MTQPRKWMIVDFSFFAWRAFYGVAKFDPVLAIRETFEEIKSLSLSFGTPILCYDLGPYARAALYPEYKYKRQESSGDAEREAAKAKLRQLVRESADEMRAVHGAKRVLCFSGYEADDHAAKACEMLPEGDSAMVCSRDKDLLQVIRPRVRLYDPVSREVTDHKKFRIEWNIHPTQWPEVKALAGCVSDCVPGIDGVGEKTAARYVAGTINHLSDKAYKIREFVKGPEYQRNLALCTLPFPGTPPVRFD